MILGQLKQADFVASRRGNAGGYYLIRDPKDLTIGEVICFIQGPVTPVDCVATGGDKNCPLQADCIFTPIWDKIRTAVTDIYDSTTFADLIEEAAKRRDDYTPGYTI